MTLPQMSPSALRIAQAGPCVTVSLSAPERKNALSATMIRELIEALDAFQAEPSARVLILKGDGGTFCAGADLKMLQARDTLSENSDFPTLLQRFTTLGKPTIAQVEGYAMGGGVGLVASCDFALAAESAILGTPEIRRGFFPMMIMAVLSRVVPRRQLLRMMLTGERLSAGDALQLGLLTEVVADALLERATQSLADKLSALSPTALRLGLLAFHRQSEQTMTAALDGLRQDLAELIASPDGQEGIKAFLEKREPKWKTP